MSKTRTARTYCRVCTVQCGLIVEIEGDQIGRIKGDTSHPASKGYSCPKGRALGQVHHHPDAILHPQMRVDGALVDSEWDRTLDDLAAKLVAVRDRDGPQSIGIFFGSGLGMDAAGYRMAEALLAGLGTPAKFTPMTIDGCAKVLTACMVGGFPGLSPRPDYDRADCVLMFGVNPMVSHGHNIAMVNPARILKDVAARGALWVIDPLRTESAAFATGHLAPLPGSDYAILAYLIRDLFDRSADASEQCVRGVEELKAAVAPFDLERTATLTGIAEYELTALRQNVEGAGCVVVETGTGITMAASANVTQWLAWVLMILTGAMNREGGVWFHPGFINRLDTFELPAIGDPRHPGAPSRLDLSGMLGEWPCAALPDEIEAGNIRAFINLGGSMVRSFPDANRLVPALKQLEVLATFEIIANETTALSTHILPTKGQLERADITLWDMLSSRLSAYHTPAVLAPQGSRRSSWWVLAELMRRMGIEVPADVPADDRVDGADEVMLARLCGNARASYAEIAGSGYIERSLEFPAKWVDFHIERIGGWQLAPMPLVEQLAEMLVNSTQRDDGILLLTPRRQRRHLNAALLFLGDSADALLHPEDAAALGIANGDRVTISTPEGAISVPASLDLGVRRGTVSVPHGHRHANVNRLTSSRIADPLTGMALYSGFPVCVTKQL